MSRDLLSGLRRLRDATRLLDLDVQTIVRALASGHSFAVLDFSHNHLGLDSARALASLLAEDKTIKMLDLTGNDIDEHGVVLVARHERHRRTRRRRLRADRFLSAFSFGFRHA